MISCTNSLDGIDNHSIESTLIPVISDVVIPTVSTDNGFGIDVASSIYRHIIITEEEALTGSIGLITEDPCEVVVEWQPSIV